MNNKLSFLLSGILPSAYLFWAMSPCTNYLEFYFCAAPAILSSVLLILPEEDD